MEIDKLKSINFLLEHYPDPYQMDFIEEWTNALYKDEYFSMDKRIEMQEFLYNWILLVWYFSTKKYEQEVDLSQHPLKVMYFPKRLLEDIYRNVLDLSVLISTMSPREESTYDYYRDQLHNLINYARLVERDIQQLNNSRDSD